MRLIDADALLEKTQFRLPTNNPIAEIYAECVAIARENIEEAPTVDAVPVVWCKDCKLYKPIDDCNGKCPFLIGDSQFKYPDGYCDLGERKDGD